MTRFAIVEPEPVALSDSELLAKLLRAMGEPTRLRILELLMERPRIQKEIVTAVGLSQGQVSNHLACLAWCGLVDTRRDGREVEYTMGDPRVVGILDLARAVLDRSGADIAACRRIDAPVGTSV
jgi:DNA-binding transcriptional ArsR family regulator